MEKIEPRLPRYDGLGEYSPELAALAGATIVRIGCSPKAKGGGLIIEYRRGGACHYLTLGFSELGLWVEDAH